MDITLYGTTRPAGQFDADSQPIQATGADYDTAKAKLEDKVPEGHQLLGISRWPC